MYMGQNMAQRHNFLFLYLNLEEAELTRASAGQNMMQNTAQSKDTRPCQLRHSSESSTEAMSLDTLDISGTNTALVAKHMK